MAELLRAGLRIGILVFGLAIFMLPFQPRDSAEFVVTVLAALVGGVFALGVVVLARTENPALPPAPGERKEYNKDSRGREH